MLILLSFATEINLFLRAVYVISETSAGDPLYTLFFIARLSIKGTLVNSGNLLSRASLIPWERDPETEVENLERGERGWTRCQYLSW